MSLLCPVCGSFRVTSVQVEEFISVPYGDKISYIKRIDTCEICKEVGDFTGSSNDVEIEEAYRSSNISAAKNIIYDLGKIGISEMTIKRILGIRFSLYEVFKEEPSLKLLQVIRTFPWILDVIDMNFDHEYIGKIVEIKLKMEENNETK